LFGATASPGLVLTETTGFLLVSGEVPNPPTEGGMGDPAGFLAAEDS